MSSAPLIREARHRAGLTQTALARRAGTSQSVVARWETGGAQPSLETLTRLIRVCGLELQTSLTETDPSEVSLIERNLALSSTERLDQLVRTVGFIRAGQASLARARASV